MNPTIYDIAEIANVSKSTVSRVLNNNPNISNKSKQKVLKAIEELNYHPSKVARGLTTGFDAILVKSRPTETTKNNPYFSEILQVIATHAEKQDYDVILQTSQDSSEEIKKTATKASSRIVKGIIMLSSPSDDSYFKELNKLNIPTVVIGKVNKEFENIYSVDTDNFKDSYNLVQYMIDLGHRNIACLYSPQDYNVAIDRLEGYKQCLLDNNLPIKENLKINCGFTMEQAFNATKGLFQSEPYPSAVFATDDLKLLSLYRILQELNISIPSDLLVGGYSNSDITSFLFPSLIQIKNPTEKLGRHATKLLFDIINNKSNIKNKTVIPTNLNIRGSKYK